MTIEEKRRKHAEYQRKRYHSMTPEQKKEFLERRKPIMKKYRENNKESINKHIREYYQENKDKKSASNKRYYDKYKDKKVTETNKKEIPVFSWNTKTKEFCVLGHHFEGTNSIEEFITYITNLNKENTNLKQVLNEIRDYVKRNNLWSSKKTENGYSYMKNECRELLEIIEKGLGEDNG